MNAQNKLINFDFFKEILPPKISIDVDEAKELIEELIKNRNIAREEKNFDEADRIREELSEKGIFLEDNNEGTSWRRRY